jgi:hypothetical protein
MKQWVFQGVDRYNKVLEYVKGRFGGRSIEIIGVPTFAFTLIENTIPFSDKSKGKYKHDYNYTQDILHKPSINLLPTRLLR